jgi:hypothetical protein
MFSLPAVLNRVDRFKDARIGETVNRLSYLGEMVVNRAKDEPPASEGGVSFHDRTGNLRSSIGYMVAYNGKIIKKYAAGKKDGKAAAIELMEALASKSTGGKALLVVVAGMEYAIYVEMKGFSVIAAAIPTRAEEKEVLGSDRILPKTTAEGIEE